MLLEKGVLTLKALDEIQQDAGEVPGGDRIEADLRTRQQAVGYRKGWRPSQTARKMTSELGSCKRIASIIRSER